LLERQEVDTAFQGVVAILYMFVLYV
jgi:hypothetical protein